MKKQIIVALCIALCSLMLASTGAVVSAAAAGFEHTSYSLVNACTVDGKWTTTTEWSDCQQTMVGTLRPIQR